MDEDGLTKDDMELLEAVMHRHGCMGMADLLCKLTETRDRLHSMVARHFHCLSTMSIEEFLKHVREAHLE